MSEQVEEYRVRCKNCQHFIWTDKATSEKYEDGQDGYHCDLCWIEPGKPRLVRSLINCTECTQTYDSLSNCECLPKMSSIKIVYDKDHKWMKPSRVGFDKNSEKAEEQKTMRMFNNRVRNRKLEAEQRQIRMDENLQKMVGLLEKKEVKNCLTNSRES